MQKESKFNPDYQSCCILNYEKLKNIFKMQLISTVEEPLVLTVDSLKEVEKQIDFIKMIRFIYIS